MNTFKPVSNYENKKSLQIMLPIWLTIVVVIAIAAIAAVIILSLAQKEIVNLNLSSEVKKSTDSLPLVVNSYIGEITVIDGETLVIKADVDKNYLTQNSLLTVKVLANTEISALEFPMVLDSDPTKTQPVKKNLTLKDLKIGQTVVVFSQNNIKNQGTFVADIIQVQVTE